MEKEQDQMTVEMTDEEIRDTLLRLWENSDSIPDDLQEEQADSTRLLETKKSAERTADAHNKAIDTGTDLHSAEFKSGRKKDARQSGGMLSQMVRVVVLPILLVMLLLSTAVALVFSGRIEEEVKQELHYSAVMIEEMFGRLYPGELRRVNVSGDSYVVCLGEHVLNEEDSLILDSLKAETGLEYSYFYESARVLTTLRNEEGERSIAASVNSKIRDQVIGGGEEAFFDNARIDDHIYYAYYMPISDDDGNHVGMVGVARSVTEVSRIRWQMLFRLGGFVLTALLLVVGISILYNRKMARTIGRVEIFLKRVADGNLSAKLDKNLLERRDELGRMAGSIVSMQKSLRELVERDALTTLHNRRYAEKQMQNIKLHAEVTGLPYTLVICDIDFFKKVNDTYGHACGDMVLRQAANILKKAMAGKGLAARWGGEEFLLVYHSLPLDKAAEELEKIRTKIESVQTVCDEHHVSVTMSFGAVQGSPDISLRESLRMADECLYQAKEQGRNQVVLGDGHSNA